MTHHQHEEPNPHYLWHICINHYNLHIPSRRKSLDAFSLTWPFSCVLLSYTYLTFNFFVCSIMKFFLSKTRWCFYVHPKKIINPIFVASVFAMPLFVLHKMLMIIIFTFCMYQKRRDTNRIYWIHKWIKYLFAIMLDLFSVSVHCAFLARYVVI